MQSPSTSNNNDPTVPIEGQTVTKVYHFCRVCRDKAWIDSDHQNHSKVTFPTEAQANLSSGACSDFIPITGVFIGEEVVDACSDFIPITGVFIGKEVITPEEESSLIAAIDSGDKWIDSQSGRRKQDFGPKVNFKKKKIKWAEFHGFPAYLNQIFNRIKKELSSEVENVLENFDPIELCHLEYDPLRGSSIDPHFDDEWLWGERLVTLNYLSTTYLTLTRPPGVENSDLGVEMKIKLPPRSLLVLSKDARFKWMHSIKRSDIVSRRVASTWREATDEFKPGGTSYESVGKYLYEMAAEVIF